MPGPGPQARDSCPSSLKNRVSSERPDAEGRGHAALESPLPWSPVTSVPVTREFPRDSAATLGSRRRPAVSPRVLGGQFSPRRVLSLCVWKCRDQTAWVPGWKTVQNLFFCPAPSRAMLLGEGSLTGAQRSPATALVFENSDSSSCDAGPAGRTQATPVNSPLHPGRGRVSGCRASRCTEALGGGQVLLGGPRGLAIDGAGASAPEFRAVDPPRPKAFWCSGSGRVLACGSGVEVGRDFWSVVSAKQLSVSLGPAELVLWLRVAPDG